MRRQHALLAALLVGLWAGSVQAAEPANALNEAEKLAGWELLFDGQSTTGWRNFKKETISDGWKVENGELSRVSKGAGDIITEDQFESFELSLEFKISPEGNSGIMFHVTEEANTPWQTGPELQINDNINGHDPEKAGWLYQLYKPGRKNWVANADGTFKQDGILDACRPAGEWNHVYLKQTPKQSVVMVNGMNYYNFVKGSADWNNRVAKSKFAQYPLFGKPTKGHICLQDHNDLVAYRNIKIRKLPANGAVPDPSHDTLAVKPVEAFPELEWADWDFVDENGRVRQMRPVVITNAGDGSGRIFVGTQDGTIHVLPEGKKSKTAKLFLDLRSQTNPSQKANEEGLLGIAFHPDHKNNRKFYVFYTSSVEPQTSYISEFQTLADNPNKADLKSERVVWKLKQPFWNHNGGTIEFGPDGYLYAAVGDGGSGDDPFDNGQNLANTFGTIIRIDVNSKAAGKEYGIPADNPFVNTQGAAPEIYAYGLRNVWRHSFDRETGVLWAADVGQNLWEEINIIEAGKNYGWNRREGLHPFGNRPAEDAKDAVDPVWEYDHEVGKSITGGNVYRGKTVPELVGKYLYADYVTGKLWALDYDVAGKKLRKNYSIPSNKMPVLTFGEGEDGEVYFGIETANGRGIYRFESQKE